MNNSSLNRNEMQSSVFEYIRAKYPNEIIEYMLGKALREREEPMPAEQEAGEPYIYCPICWNLVSKNGNIPEHCKNAVNDSINASKPLGAREQPGKYKAMLHIRAKKRKRWVE